MFYERQMLKDTVWSVSHSTLIFPLVLLLRSSMSIWSEKHIIKSNRRVLNSVVNIDGGLSEAYVYSRTALGCVWPLEKHSQSVRSITLEIQTNELVVLHICICSAERSSSPVLQLFDRIIISIWANIKQHDCFQHW